MYRDEKIRILLVPGAQSPDSIAAAIDLVGSTLK
jgi:hypothetical protein